MQRQTIEDGLSLGGGGGQARKKDSDDVKCLALFAVMDAGRGRRIKLARSTASSTAVAQRATHPVLPRTKLLVGVKPAVQPKTGY